MALQGTFDDMSLSDILQSASASAKTGALFIYHEKEECVLYLKDGRLVHAVSGTLTGEEAFYRAARWDTGRFELVAGRTAPALSIQNDPLTMLLEAAHREDEWEHIAARVPSPSAVPEFCEDTSVSEDAELSTYHWSVMSHIDGRRSVADIAALTHRSPEEVSRILYALSLARLIHIQVPSETR